MATLYSPSGEKYDTDSKTETTRLLSRGYTEKKPTPTQVAVNTGEKPAPKAS